MLVKRTFQPEATRGVALTAAGVLLVASTYGMARFGVGLLHPAMAVERPGVARALPSAGAAQFASYCVAAGLAGFLVPARSRAVAGAAGVAAGLGCLGLALSTSAGWFVASAYVSGAGAGLASPALVGLLDAVVPERMAGAAQAVVNSGTSVGVVMTGMLATAVTAPGAAWLLMAVACLAAGSAVVVLSSGATVVDAAHGPGPAVTAQPGSYVLVGAAAHAGPRSRRHLGGRVDLRPHRGRGTRSTPAGPGRAPVDRTRGGRARPARSSPDP